MPTRASSTLVSRFIIVAIPEARDLVNTSLRHIDPTSVGDPLVQGLRIAPPPAPPWDGEGVPPAPPAGDDTIVAYWCSWAMDSATTANLNSRWNDPSIGWQPALNGAERAIYTPETLGNVRPLGSGQRVWLFDGLLVTSAQVLTTLGLARRR